MSMKWRNWYEIRDLREKVREELVLAMRERVEWFKEYLTGKYKRKYEFPPYGYYVKDKHYGCKDDFYYYCKLPEVVPFIYKNSLYHAEWIFFNDKFKCWFVYDKDKNEYVTFEALDTDSQIALFNMLFDFVARDAWSEEVEF